MIPSNADITIATTLAIAAGRAAADSAASVAASEHEVGDSLRKLSLRFAELALESLGGEPGKDSGDADRA